MNELLVKYDKDKVNVFINYINDLKKDDKNWWIKKASKNDLANIFIKVYQTGLTIDGDSVTLNYLKKIVVTYDYHAYINKILINYPETIFDFNLVNQGDEFSFKKESGKVIYLHKINNPFETKKDIIGAYGVLKNRKGEFLEIITKEDIAKFKKTSKMTFIWNSWEDRMILKSIIKRLCNVHFKDLVKDIDKQDNELNEPNRVMFDDEILRGLDDIATIEELNIFYKENVNKVEDKKQFIDLCASKKIGL